MPFSVDELIEKARNQWGRQRYDESLISALAAVELDDTSGEAWWQVALSYESLGKPEQAIAALQETVELIPHGANVWARLGDLLMKQGETDEARDAFETAIELNQDQPRALAGLAQIYAEDDDQGQDDDEISVLQKIAQNSSLTKIQVNRLGILYYRNARYQEAIHCWKIDVHKADHPSQRFNLGLAYSNPTIGQIADAIDMWRLVLQRWPDYERAQTSITNLLPNALITTKNARLRAFANPEDRWYVHYINPFELINAPDDVDIEELDPKAIQRLKKVLFQEIELEDGRVPWMQGVTIDKSRAIGLCDELNDEEKKEWHWMVYSNNPLLQFLTKGSVEHFLVNEYGSELETIEFLEWDQAFSDWLGRFFAPQYDRVLAKAIDKMDTIIIGCLLQGRRWVPLSMTDDCYNSSRKSLRQSLALLSEISDASVKIKPSHTKIQFILIDKKFLDIMNLLPVHFETEQNEAASLLRNISVESYNSHEDIDLSKKVIEYAIRFKYVSKDTASRLQEDLRTIEGIISEQRKHEVKLARGKVEWEVVKEGVRQGGKFIAANDISSARWGVVISLESSGKHWDFLIAFRAHDGRQILFQWKVPENIKDKQQANFDLFVKAAFNYVFPTLIDATEAKLSSGNSIQIGPCKVTREGIGYQTEGWIFTSDHFAPWSRVKTKIENGEMTIFDATQPNKQVSFSYRETDNAPLINILINMKNGKR